MLNKTKSSYNQLLKATSILGSSQLVNIALRLIRTKLLAMLLGTAGIGLIGTFQSIVDMISSFCGLGLAPGTVKEVSQYSSGSGKKLSKTIFIFRRWFAVTACFGAIVCMVSPLFISNYFNVGSYRIPIALLGVCVFFTIISTGRMAILQGLRKIPHMAKATIMESAVGLVVVVCIYYYFGIEGIIPAFILNSIIIYVCINFFYRKIAVKKEPAPLREVLSTGINAFKLGLFITLGACVSTASMFAVRFVVILYSGHTEAIGLVQSVWTITNVFAAFIISSAGTDYFTRLCLVSGNNVKTRTLVNEQSYIVLMLSSPVIVGIILFSSYILATFYTSEFVYAQSMLQWQAVGIFFKIVATPIASVLLAKNKGLLYLLSEVIFFGVYLLLSYMLVPLYDIAGAGIAYIIAYIFYLASVLGMVYWLTKYTWNPRVLFLLSINGLLIVLAFYIAHFMPHQLLILGISLLVIAMGFSMFCLSKIFSLSQLKEWFEKK